MVTTIRMYKIPVFFALLALSALTLWSVGERKNIERIRNSGQRQLVAELFSIAESIINELSPDDSYQNAQITAALEKLVETSPLQFIVLNQNGSPVFQISDSPGIPEITSPEGIDIRDGQFVLWRKINMLREEAWSETPMSMERPGSNPPAASGQNPWHLIVGGESIPDKQEYALVLRRMYITNIAAFLSVTAGFVVWIMMIKSRQLTEQLRVARLRSAHMEDLELSAAGLAHETKNPLGIIAGIAHQVFSDPAISPRNRERLEQIIHEVEKTTERLGHFLKFAGHQTATMSSLDAAGVIEKIATILQTEFEAAGVELTTNCPHLQIRGDENMLRQILVNLLMNSLQASKNGGIVTVEIKQDGKHAELIVTDRGGGIPPELLPKVCKPYVTGHHEGHGLGLAIVKRYVDEHGWTLTLSSEENRGTAVTIGGIEVAET